MSINIDSKDTSVIIKIGKMIGNDKFCLDSLFADHMVLQRNKFIPIRGWAVPNSVVYVKLGDVSGRSIAGTDGRFTVSLPPQQAAQSLTLAVENQGHSIILNDVAIGDVFLLSGQSNMEFTLKECLDNDVDMSPEELSNIRYFRARSNHLYGRQSSINGQWRPADISNVHDFSGVGFFFARALYRKHQLPIGLINISVGGINIESFVSLETLMQHEEYREELLAYESSASQESAVRDGRIPSWQEKLTDGYNKLFPEDPEDDGLQLGFAENDFDDSSWEQMYLPDSWTQAGHNHAGIFWFRKNLDLPANWAGRDLELHLGAVDKADRVYFNGQLIGSTGKSNSAQHWTILRQYRIPGELVKPTGNLLAVRAASLFSICTDGGLTGPEEAMFMQTTNGSEKISLTGLWRYCETMDAGVIGMTFMRSLGAGAPGSFHMLFDNFIAPLSGTPIQGVIWYQGEANSICTAQYYRKLLRDMILEHRYIFADPQLPFLIIQLPEYGTKHLYAPHSQWARIREAQMLAAQDADADLIVTLGWGDAVELHPRKKLPVGEILAQAVWDRMHGRQPAAGPVFKSMQLQGNALEITFQNAVLPAAGTRIRGFAVAGADNKAYSASAEVISADKILVIAPEVPSPCRVWYAWADNPQFADLQSKDQIKGSCFRAALSGENDDIRAVNLIHK